MSTSEYSLNFRSASDELENIRQFVASHARRFGFHENRINEIQLAVDEACTNIIKHAYDWDQGKSIRIDLKMEDQEMVISIKDSGKAFDPEHYTMPSMEEQLEQKKRSGYGILLMRSLMDKVEYRKKNSRNEILMTKKR